MPDWIPDINGRHVTGVGHNPPTTAGTIITAGASVKGAYVQLVSGASTLMRAESIMLGIYSPTLVSPAPSPGLILDFFLDFAIGAIGAETILINNLLFTSTFKAGSVSGTQPGFYMNMPIQVPQGSRLSARLQCSDPLLTPTCHLATSIVSGTWQTPSGFSQVVPTNISTSLTQGVRINPGGLPGIKGNYALLSSTDRTYDFHGIFIAIGSQERGVNMPNLPAQWLMDIAINSGQLGASYVDIIENIPLGTQSTDYDTIRPNLMYFPVYIPKHPALYARAQCNTSDVDSRKFNIAIYGVV